MKCRACNIRSFSTGKDIMRKLEGIHQYSHQIKARPTRGPVSSFCGKDALDDYSIDLEGTECDAGFTR